MAAPLRTPMRPSALASVQAGTSTDALDIPRTPLAIRSLSGRGARRPAIDAVDRVRGEFVEMRGFSPTSAQAARLFDLAPDECDRILTRLVAEGFLQRSPDGRYRSLRT